MENKEFYMEPVAETVIFPRQDIITASVGTGNGPSSDVDYGGGGDIIGGDTGDDW